MKCFLCGDTGRISGGDDAGGACPQCAVLFALRNEAAEANESAAFLKVACDNADARIAELEASAAAMREAAMAATRERRICPDCDVWEARASAMHGGLGCIATERLRQIEKGWTRDHDAEHPNGELAMAAVCYASTAPVYAAVSDRHSFLSFKDPWPFDEASDKRPRLGGRLVPVQDIQAEQRVRMLAKAGALIAAEIDRISGAPDAGRALQQGDRLYRCHAGCDK